MPNLNKKAWWIKLICFLLGHDDPVLNFGEFMTKEAHYDMWKNHDRVCKRCGISVKPEDIARMLEEIK